MKTAFQHVNTATISFLREKVGRITDYEEANELLIQLSGIDRFFRNKDEFLTFLDLLKPCSVVCEKIARREYGDFQTPLELSNTICLYLASEDILPNVIIEPTFGKGSFIISALRHFSQTKRIYGVEIYEPYYWQTKFLILELFINTPNLNKPKIFLYCDDIFNFDFSSIEKSIETHSILVLGNPPWVTNSELSTLNSSNLPAKSNFKFYTGFEAITGKGNFDIGEYIILTMFKLFSKRYGHMAMLAKNSVIKNVIYDLPKMNYRIGDMVALKINTKYFFDASVEASLFKCSFKLRSSSPICKVSLLNSPHLVENEFGWVNNKFVSDVSLYEKHKKYDGVCSYIWRQGVKHDCSKIMELDMVNNKYVNGFEVEVNLENDLTYGLVKSSDLCLPVITKPRKYVIITQKKIGEDTSYLQDKFPNLYKYLSENEQVFLQRKSSIYAGKAPFSIFGVGDYSFKPYKVAISGLYKRSTFSLILPYKSKPMMLDDTCYFLGFDYISDAIIIWAILNSEYIQKLLTVITFLDSKRPYTKEVLMRLSLNEVAEDLTFDQIKNIIKDLPTNIPIHLTKNEWDAFLTKDENKRLKPKQLSLFETFHNVKQGGFS